MEISPMQYGLLSKRGREQYDTKRNQEWRDSASCAKDYEEACATAYLADPSILTSPALVKDAENAIRTALIRAKEGVLQAQVALVKATNQILPTSDVEVGDRIFTKMGGRYGIVEKRSKASASILLDNGSLMPVKLAACTWLSYSDVQAAASLGLTSAHPRNRGSCTV